MERHLSANRYQLNPGEYAASLPLDENGMWPRTSWTDDTTETQCYANVFIGVLRLGHLDY